MKKIKIAKRDLNKITTGMIKYKTLIELLKLENKRSGDPRKYQIKHLQQYMDIRHVKASTYEIIKIYKTKKPMVSQQGKSVGSRGNNADNGIYDKYIEKLILDLLVQKHSSSEEQKIFLSRDKMLLALNMVNENYTYCKFNKNELANFINADEENIKEFYSLNNKNLLDTIDRSLKKLANKSLIDWQLVTTVNICEKVYMEDMGEWIFTEHQRHATYDERRKILAAESKVLEGMGISNKKLLFLRGKYEEFISEVKYELSLENTGIKSYYKSYDIVFTENVVKAKLKLDEYLLQYAERKDLMLNLNTAVTTHAVKLAKTRHSKAKKELEKSTPLGRLNTKAKQKVRRGSDTYTKDNEKIVAAVIKKDTKCHIADKR